MTASMCQSCGVAVSGSEYCTDCFRDGAFTEPNLTQAEMINRTTLRLVSTRNMLEYQARQRANQLIPTLTRWQE